MRNINVSIELLTDTLRLLVEKRPTELFRVPAVRGICSAKLLEESEVRKVSADLVADEKFIRQNTISHNHQGLSAKPQSDRGAEITEILSNIISRSDRHLHRVLHVGPRNMSEIFASLSLGFDLERIFAIDLISFHPIVDIGDVHDVKHAENTFDIVVLGWILAYSANPEKAVSEVIRVARDGAVIVVGWDFSQFPIDEGNRWCPADGWISEDDTTCRVGATSDVEALFRRGGVEIHAIFRKDPEYPFDSDSRRTVLVFEIKKNIANACKHQYVEWRRCVITAPSPDVASRWLGLEGDIGSVFLGDIDLSGYADAITRAFPPLLERYAQSTSLLASLSSALPPASQIGEMRALLEIGDNGYDSLADRHIDYHSVMRFALSIEALLLAERHLGSMPVLGGISVFFDGRRWEIVPLKWSRFPSKNKISVLIKIFQTLSPSGLRCEVIDGSEVLDAIENNFSGVVAEYGMISAFVKRHQVDVRALSAAKEHDVTKRFPRILSLLGRSTL